MNCSGVQQKLLENNIYTQGSSVPCKETIDSTAKKNTFCWISGERKECRARFLLTEEKFEEIGGTFESRNEKFFTSFDSSLCVGRMYK
jgi:hypothetical protein